MSSSSQQAKILVLYTGGTLGMTASKEGLVPSSGFEQRLCAEYAFRFKQEAPTWLFRELTPLIDSANLTQTHWLAMCDAIVQAVEHEGCEGVLLLHGTDTLAYSAAALSFLLRGLPVPVILTGAMLPAGVEGSDAWPNVFGALALLQAGLEVGVWLFFQGERFEGIQVTKRAAHRLEAFYNPQRPQSVLPEWAAHLPDYRQARQPVPLAVLPFFPGMTLGQVDAVLNSGARGVVLECYGSGTGPADDAHFLAALRAAHQRGVWLLAISQCPEGAVSFGQYAADSALAACGVRSGAGLNRETALALLFAALSATHD